MKHKNLKCTVLISAFLMSAATLLAQNVTVTGTVKDESGLPAIGAGVMQSGTRNGVATDIDGNYTITVPSSATLVFSMVGYVDQTVPVNGRSRIDVTLYEDTNLLDEVVFVGYGVQKKKLVTGATINIDGETIAKQNTTNALGSLYSSVPGVTITQANGQPWSGYNITVRGLSTTGDSRPLYVVDGIAGGDINNLNPSDIESIDILKDAASAAIYGARAANGVVLVTTKQGQKGKVNVNYDGYYSMQKPNFNGVEPLNASEYLDLIDRAYRSTGSLGENEHYFDLEALMPVQNEWMKSGKWNGTNWLEESVNKKAASYNNALTITGGNDLIRFAMGFTKSHVDGLLAYPKRTYYDRTTVRYNSDITLWKKNGRDIIKVGENATLSMYVSNSVQTNGIYNSDVHTYLSYTPLLPAYDLDGTLYTFEKQLRDQWNVASTSNLLESQALGEYEGRNYMLQSNFYVEVSPHRDLRFRSVYGYSFRTSASRSYTPEYILNSTTSQDEDRVSQNSSLSNSWTWENTLSWTHEFGLHHVDALVGASMEAQGLGLSVGGSRKQTLFGTWEAANINSCESDIDAKSVSVSGTNTVPYMRLVSQFARANYNYNEKYLATVIVRRDGSSNFASGHRFGIFPSVSVGWNITNEPWMESTRGWLSSLKLRSSWGQNGNCNIANFQYLATISLSAPYDVSYAGTSVSVGAYPDIIPNANLTWEKTEQTDIGLDARLFGGRMTTTLDYYIKDTKDWLVDAPALASYGTGAPTINGGAVRNEGFEIALGWNDHLGDFFYSASANLSKNRNEVLYIDNADGIIHGPIYTFSQSLAKYNTFEARAGKPIGYFCGIASEGIFQNQSQIDEYNAKGYKFIDGYEAAKPGDVIWIDQNGDGLYNEQDIVEIGNPHPDYNLGFNLTLEYKGLDFSVSGSGAFGQQVICCYRTFLDGDQNFTTNFVNRLWTGEGSTNSFPRFSSGSHNNFSCNGYTGDIWVQDADYVKFRTITLGYDFKKLFKKLPMASCRIYFTGQNLLTLTKYDGMDPEVGYGGSVNSSGSIIPWSSGIDVGYYPSAKAYMFGLSLKF